jgi:hypothetical protein
MFHENDKISCLELHLYARVGEKDRILGDLAKSFVSFRERSTNY